MSVVAQPFYRGFPSDGTAASNRTDWVTCFDVGCRVPQYRKWRIEYITVVNLTNVEAFYTVAIFPKAHDFTAGGTVQPDMAAMNATLPLPRSTSNPTAVPLATYLAYSEPVPPNDGLTKPVVGWALSEEQLGIGVYPGYIQFLGYGGVCLTVSGKEWTPS